jgi:hypothetical protein
MTDEDAAASTHPMVVMLDEETGERYARMVSHKGVGDASESDWIAKDMSDELKSWGHTGREGGHIILKSDSEAAITALCDSLAAYHGGKVVPERPPVGQSQSNGAVEEAGKTVREFTRVLKLQLEDRTLEKITSSSTVTPWMVRWAAMLISRYSSGKDGLTPYERRRGKACRTPSFKFGEYVWFRQLGKDSNKGLDTAWQQGIWLGHARTSNEHLIGTTEGVLRAHSVKRHDPQHQWHAATVRDLKGTPQQPDPSRPTTRVPN